MNGIEILNALIQKGLRLTAISFPALGEKY